MAHQVTKRIPGPTFADGGQVLELGRSGSIAPGMTADAILITGDASRLASEPNGIPEQRRYLRMRSRSPITFYEDTLGPHALDIEA